MNRNLDTDDPLEWMARLNGSPWETHKFCGSYLGIPIFEVLDEPRA